MNLLYPLEWAGTEKQRIDAIKDTIQGVLNAKAFSNPVSSGKSMIHRRMAELMYDLGDFVLLRARHGRTLKNAGGQPRYLSVTVSILKEELSLPQSSDIDSYTGGTRALLAEALVDLWNQLQPVVFRPLREDPAYVQRPDLQTQFQEAIRTLQKRGKRVLVFRGDAGTGKSTLALTLAPTIVESDDDVVVIRTHSDRRLTDDILKYFRRKGVDASGWTDRDARRRLRQRLTGEDAPPVVVLDNVSDRETLDDLLPEEEPRSFVFVTCRKKLISGERGAEITVGSMAAEEAEAMVETRLSGRSDEAVKALALRLGFRPLAIEHACTYLRQKESMTVEQFCEALDRSLAEILDSLPGEETITAIYRMILKELESRANTLRLLDLVLCSPLLSVKRRTPRLLWADLRAGVEPSEERNRRLDEYMRRIDRKSVV